MRLPGLRGCDEAHSVADGQQMMRAGGGCPRVEAGKRCLPGGDGVTSVQKGLHYN
jgi:hypothetical protein